MIDPSAMVRASLYQIGLGLQQMPQSSLSNMLGQSLAQSDYMMTGLQNAYAPPKPTGEYEGRRAKEAADEAEPLLDRMWFWSAIEPYPVVGIIAEWVLCRLAERLDAATDEIERFVKLAEAYKAAGTTAEPKR